MSYDNPNLAIVKAVTDQHMSVSQAARHFKRSRQWIYTLIKRYHAGGPDAVLPQSTAPRSTPNKTTDATIKNIIAIRPELTAKGADNGPETIASVLTQRGIHAPAESTIRRILTQQGMVTPQPTKRPKTSLRRFEATLPNECWQADVTYIRLRNGKAIDVLDFLDDHSRYLLYLVAHPRVYGPTVTTAMHTITDTYGLPQSTLTDNGLIFTARLAGAKGGKTAFENFLEHHSIKQKDGRVAHPQTQRKIERFHQTWKKWIRAQTPAEAIPELQQQLDTFRHWYNTERRHRRNHRRTQHRHRPSLPTQPGQEHPPHSNTNAAELEQCSNPATQNNHVATYDVNYVPTDHMEPLARIELATFSLRVKRSAD